VQADHTHSLAVVIIITTTITIVIIITIFPLHPARPSDPPAHAPCSYPAPAPSA
jgi:hypothetical protein